MNDIEILEQDAKDRGLINSDKEHAFWGNSMQDAALRVKGYVLVKDGKDSIVCGDNTLYKIKRTKEEIAARKAAK